MLSPPPTQKMTFYLKASNLRPQVKKPSLAKNYCQLINNDIDKLKDDDDLFINGFRLENLIEASKNENNLKGTFKFSKNDNITHSNKFNNKLESKNANMSNEKEGNNFDKERDENKYKSKNSFEELDALDKIFDQNDLLENFDLKTKNNDNFEYQISNEKMIDDKSNEKKAQLKNNFFFQNSNNENFKKNERILKNQKFKNTSRDENFLRKDTKMGNMKNLKNSL